MKIVSSIKHVIKVLLKKDLLINMDIRLNKKRLGTKYGGYWIYPDNLSKNSIIYSFGIGKDVSFDIQLIQNFGCKVFAFDPTPDSIDWIMKQELPRDFHFYPIGLADFDGKALFYGPKNSSSVSFTLLHRQNTIPIEIDVFRLTSIMKMLNHEKIDLLKLDIEGYEYLVIDDILKSDLKINQVCLEFHHRFKQYNVKDTLSALNKFKSIGFKLFSKENDVYSLFYSNCTN
jgi:FkbM family methyltransferase